MKKYEYKTDEHGFPIRVEIKKSKSKVKSEATIQKEIAEVFNRDRWEIVRYNSGTMQGDGRYVAFNTNLTTGMTAGHPDLIAFKGTHAVRIECKTETGKVSPSQAKYAANGLLYDNPILVMRSKVDAIMFCDRAKTHGIKSAIVDWVKK